MSERVLDLSKLNEFVLKTLKSTEEVKNILQTQCEEAKYALAPWQLETIVNKEVDKNSCTCVGILSSEDHVKEIASGIEDAVAQARKLREKLAINVLKEKKLSRRPSVHQIYASGSKEIDNRSKLIESEARKENGRIDTAGAKPSNLQRNRVGIKRNETRRAEEEKQGAFIKEDENSCAKNNSRILNARGNLQKNNSRIKIPETRKSSSNGKKVVEQKRTVDKKLVGTSPYNSLVAASKAEEKSKTKKDFIAANKSSVRNTRAVNSPGTSTARKTSSKSLIQPSESIASTKSSDSLISRAASAAQFENLISKISLESENCLKNSTEGNGCPIHDINAPKFVEETIYTSVDVAEGLDRFGVPPELVKTLKLYHSYLNNQSTSKPKDKRGEKAEGRFLEAFDTMNRARRKVSANEKLDNLCKDFLPAMKESYNKKMDFIELSRLKIRYTDLDSTCKSLQIRSISPTKIKIDNLIDKPLAKSSYERNRAWRINSVWNEACIPNLEGMSRARCIRYANKNQLLELFDYIQRIQQIKYQTSLTKLLNKEVVPSVRNCLEPTSEEYINAYKMISIISNLLHLKVPVLVRTDE